MLYRLCHHVTAETNIASILHSLDMIDIFDATDNTQCFSDNNVEVDTMFLFVTWRDKWEVTMISQGGVTQGRRAE